MMPFERWRGGRKALVVSSTVALLGLVPTFVGFGLVPRRTLYSWLFAWMYWGGLALGSLLWVSIFQTSRARWPVVFRRFLETCAGTLPAFAALFLPILIGAGTMYDWVHPNLLTEKVQEHVRKDAAWLNLPAWLGRSIFYLLVWAVVAEFLLRWSRRQDDERLPSWTIRQRRLAAGTLPVTCLALSFAMLDWVMSPEPRWNSSIFGLYVFTGITIATFGLAALSLELFDGPDLFGRIARKTHRLSLGRLILGFTAFWFYVAWDQYMLVWVANLPDEVPWLRVRTTGGWSVVAWLVVAMQFGFALALLLSRDLKLSRKGLVFISVWVLAAHAVDLWWLIIPAVEPAAPAVAWSDVTAFLGLGGVSVALVLWRMRGHYTVPVGDPYLDESARYHHE